MAFQSLRKWVIKRGETAEKNGPLIDEMRRGLGALKIGMSCKARSQAQLHEIGKKKRQAFCHCRN